MGNGQARCGERWSVPELLFLWMLSKWISGLEDGMATSAMPWGVAVGSDLKIEMQLRMRAGYQSECEWCLRTKTE